MREALGRPVVQRALADPEIQKFIIVLKNNPDEAQRYVLASPVSQRFVLASPIRKLGEEYRKKRERVLLPQLPALQETGSSSID